MTFKIDLEFPECSMPADVLVAANKICGFSYVHPEDPPRLTRWATMSDEQLSELAGKVSQISDPQELHYQVLVALSQLRGLASDSYAVAMWARQANNHFERLPAAIQSLVDQVAQQVESQSRPNMDNQN